MKPNLWLYSSQEEMMGSNDSLIVFGAGVFKRAKVINEFDQLNRIYLDRKNGAAKISDPILQEFIFEYLIDCVRIAIFFENYMKAELIVNGFCVHKIKKGIPKFEALAEEQRKGPVKVRDIHSVEAFQVKNQTKTTKKQQKKQPPGNKGGGGQQKTKKTIKVKKKHRATGEGKTQAQNHHNTKKGKRGEGGGGGGRTTTTTRGGGGGGKNIL
ncbi:MAG: hypothetical protein IPM81_22675 [Saprospirales bacterium]|nr:hypothetical protein [Saprospirales bacterium]